MILFPQLVCVVHFKRHCNTYGSLAAYFVGFFLRALGGEDIVGLPAILKYPFYNPVDGQLFPFRTLAMILSFITLLGVSTLSKWLFEGGHLPPRYDYFRCVVNIPDDSVVVQEPHEEMTVLNVSTAILYQTSEMNGRINPGLITEDETNNKLLVKRNSQTDSITGKMLYQEIHAQPSALVGSIEPGQVIVTKL